LPGTSRNSINLSLERPFPGFVPSPESLEKGARILANSDQLLAQGLEQDNLVLNLPRDEARDLFIALMHVSPLWHMANEQRSLWAVGALGTCFLQHFSSFRLPGVLLLAQNATNSKKGVTLMTDHTNQRRALLGSFHPRFAAFYEWFARRPQQRRLLDPLARPRAGQASGVVLEVGAGTGQNFSWYDATRVERVEATEPDSTMLAYARERASQAPVPLP